MASLTLDGNSSNETEQRLLSVPTSRSTSERIQALDLGKLPPRARFELMQAAAQADGWRPKELADEIGERQGFVSELSHELRLAVGFANGVFPDLRPDEYEDLLLSVAENGVRVPVVLDEHGDVIDGHARLRAYDELQWIAEASNAQDEWRRTLAEAKDDPKRHTSFKVKQARDDLARLGNYDPDLVALACERHWQDVPVERREGLSPEERRRLIVSLNAGPKGRVLKRTELRILIEVELMVDRVSGEHRSLREIAKLVGCDHMYVHRIKQAMLEEEEALANPQAEVESVDLSTAWRTITSHLSCPHCSYALALERAGKEFRLELMAGEAA